MTPGELRRLYLIIRTFLSYGLDELIPKMRITLPLRIGRRMLFWMPNRHKNQPLGERLRLALQELGPVWIKFGQMLSTRRDLFPPQIADQLALLQDRVAPFDGRLAKQQIEQAMGGLPVEAWFDDFSIEPLASASIAQVHTARLKENGKEVVIKVIRPDIVPVIKADMKLIYRLARWVPRLLPDGRRLRPQEVVREYEKTLLDELNLLRESANAIQLRRNFEDSPMLYVPEVYSDYCSEGMMVMERIYGIPVSDVEALEAQGTNMKLLAERGVQVFFTQVFRDSFFHADMHPGNIFVSRNHPEDPQYIGIDCGIGLDGCAFDDDQDYLREIRVAWLNNLHNGVDGEVDYKDVLKMATSRGAKISACGLSSGILEPGGTADFTMISVDSIEKPYADPGIDPLALLVQRGTRQSVIMTCVNGKIAWQQNDESRKKEKDAEIQICTAIKELRAKDDGKRDNSIVLQHVHDFYTKRK